MKRARDANDIDGGDHLVFDEYGNENIHANHIESSSNNISVRRKCPYLDTINRQLLDFDMEKLCCITLTNMNVYVCLVCGKFFQGRGKSTPAYTHSVQFGHFVFMNLNNNRVYCLPDNYEVMDVSLVDVKKCLDPRFSLSDILSLNQNTSLARDVHGVAYLPGFVGLNNLKCTDYVNVVLHALSHVTPIRNFFLRFENYKNCRSTLVLKFGEVVRKLWSKDNFKSVVSPQEFLQEISTASKRRFVIGHQSEAVDFLIWLLDGLHRGLLLATTDTKEGKGEKITKKKRHGGASTIIYQTFQGFVEVTSLTKRKVMRGGNSKPSSAENTSSTTTSGYEDDQPSESLEQNEEGGDIDGAGGGVGYDDEGRAKEYPDETLQNERNNIKPTSEWDKSVTVSPFRVLSLDIPPTPLFKDSQGGLVIPQIPLFEVLKKFNGDTWSDQIVLGQHVRKQYRIHSLPPYLILHLARFRKNNFFVEKNPTIVTFPVKNLELRDYLFSDEHHEHQHHHPLPFAATSAASLQGMSEEELKESIRFALKPLGGNGGSSSSSSGDSLVDENSLLSATGLQPSDLLQALDTAATSKDPPVPMTKTDLENMAKICLDSNGLSLSTKYGLIANICHDSPAAQGMSIGLGSETIKTNVNVIGQGCYRIHTQNKATGQWFELQDLHVTETMPQLIGLSESYLLVYEKKPTATLPPSQGAGAGSQSKLFPAAAPADISQTA